MYSIVPSWIEKITFSISKRGNGRHMKILWVLGGFGHVKLKVFPDRAVFQSALAVFYFTRTKTETRVSTLSETICFYWTVKWKPLFCV